MHSPIGPPELSATDIHIDSEGVLPQRTILLGNGMDRARPSSIFCSDTFWRKSMFENVHPAIR